MRRDLISRPRNLLAALWVRRRDRRQQEGEAYIRRWLEKRGT